MALIKARNLEPQRDLGNHGAISGTAEMDLLAGTLVVVTGHKGTALTVRAASNASRRLSSGLLYITKHRVSAGGMVHCYSYMVIPNSTAKKDGQAIWLARDGKWTLTKPKACAVQVGKAMDCQGTLKILLAPQGRY